MLIKVKWFVCVVDKTIWMPLNLICHLYDGANDSRSSSSSSTRSSLRRYGNWNDDIVESESSSLSFAENSDGLILSSHQVARKLIYFPIIDKSITQTLQLRTNFSFAKLRTINFEHQKVNKLLAILSRRRDDDEWSQYENDGELLSAISLAQECAAIVAHTTPPKRSVQNTSMISKTHNLSAI